MYMNFTHCHFRAQKVSIFRGFPSNGPFNGFAPIKGGGGAVQCYVLNTAHNPSPTQEVKSEINNSKMRNA